MHAGVLLITVLGLTVRGGNDGADGGTSLPPRASLEELDTASKSYGSPLTRGHLKISGTHDVHILEGVPLALAMS